MRQLRPMTPDEHTTITRLRQSRTEAARTVERARIIWLASQGWRVPGRQIVRITQDRPDQPAERARQEIDYGRRGGGYIVGAFQPATGDAVTRPTPAAP